MPIISFTDQGIRNLKPCEKQVDYWDKKIKGLGLRIGRSGKKSWMARYQVSNKRGRYTFGSYPALSLSDARTKVLKIINQVAEGIDPSEKRALDKKAITFDELSHEYMERHAKPKKVSWKEDQRKIDNKLLPKWKSYKAKDIKKVYVLKLLDEMVNKGTPIEANRVLTLVKKIFNFAIKADLIPAPNPCDGIERPSKEYPRDRVLLLEEIKKFWESTEQEDVLPRSKMRLRLLTGQRDLQLQQIELNELDLKSGWWNIPGSKTKNRRSHRLPLSSQSIEVIKEVMKIIPHDSKWLFPSPQKPQEHIGLCNKAYQRVRERCGFEFEGKDLRRSMASYLAEQKVSRFVIKLLLNHSMKDITDVYDQYAYSEEKRDAVNLWGNIVENIVKGNVDFSKVIELRSNKRIAN